MRTRLLEIIYYETGGKRTPFAERCGWSQQYLSKLLGGDNFGLQPVLTLLSTFPEISARWFLFGQGSMLEAQHILGVQRQALSQVVTLLDLERFIPVMTGDEVREFEDAVCQGRQPSFAPERLAEWEASLADRNSRLDDIFAQATLKSDELCNLRTANK